MTYQELGIDGLRRRYGAVTALDGLTFGVPAGQVFGFLGPNGAGKTTTMRAIFGVTALDAGEIRWRGRPVDEAARRTFGHMLEERWLKLLQSWTGWQGHGRAGTLVCTVPMPRQRKHPLAKGGTARGCDHRMAADAVRSWQHTRQRQLTAST